MDTFDIWHTSEFQDADGYGILDDSHQVLSYVVLSKSSSVVKPLRIVWTQKSSRGKGLATIILVFLMRKLGYKLSMEKSEAFSPDSRKMISKGLEHSKFRMFDTDGKEIESKDARKILQDLRDNDVEVILSEKQIDFEMFGNCKNGDVLHRPYSFVLGDENISEMD
jgi:hypothetical protein